MDPRAPKGPLWRAPSAPVGAEFWAQPADLQSTPSTQAGLRYELDLGASRSAKTRSECTPRAGVRGSAKTTFLHPHCRLQQAIAQSSTGADQICISPIQRVLICDVSNFANYAIRWVFNP
eukprot:2928761-Pleurochrysis_carterae.AAC.2